MKKALPPQYPYLHGAAEFDPLDLNLNIRGNPEVPGRDRAATLSAGAVRRQDDPVQSRAADVCNWPRRWHTIRLPHASRSTGSGWLCSARDWSALHPTSARVGDRPALPELLEFLAARFVEQKYSVKAMIREIVLSDAYQRSSASNAANDKDRSGQSLPLAA